jgi:hypothetical protein
LEEGIIVHICSVCGNEREAGSLICRFCGAKQESDDGKGGTLHKTVNLEYGHPFAATAIKKLLSEIQAAKIERVKVLTVIHGYGASGQGGVIRDECRKSLDYLCSMGIIKEYIPGEDFSGRSGVIKALFRRFPELTRNRNISRNNPGVTLVVMP